MNPLILIDCAMIPVADMYAMDVVVTTSYIRALRAVAKAVLARAASLGQQILY